MDTLNVLNDPGYDKLPGPKLAPKNNLRLFYAIACSIFTILLLIISITGYTGYTVSTVHQVALNTQKLIDDVHSLIPDAKMGIELLKILCTDKNFTRIYNNTQEWCNKYV